MLINSCSNLIKLKNIKKITIDLERFDALIDFVFFFYLSNQYIFFPGVRKAVKNNRIPPADCNLNARSNDGMSCGGGWGLFGRESADMASTFFSVSHFCAARKFISIHHWTVRWSVHVVYWLVYRDLG